MSTRTRGKKRQRNELRETHPARTGGANRQTRAYEQLVIAADTHRRAVDDLDRAARQARASGLSWAQIAAPMRVTRQAVAKKYGGTDAAS